MEERHPQIGGLTARYKHGVSGRLIPKAKPAPALPTASNVEVDASRRSLKERLRRAKGRSSTQLTQPGSLTGDTSMRGTLG